MRRRGTEKIPPEEIVDNSPLFVAKRVKANELVAYSDPQALNKHLMKRQVSRPLDIRAAECGIVNVLKKAGLRVKNGKLYEIRVHSIRKFFRTQLEALGAPRDYIEYMMGHKLSTYHDIQMKGIEFLRGVYAAANFRIQSKESTSLADVLKELIRAKGEDPSKYLKAEIESAIDVITPVNEPEIYARVLLDILRRDLLGFNPESGGEDKILIANRGAATWPSSSR